MNLIRVAYTADENFVFPALVSLHSLLLRTKNPVEVFFMDCGIGPGLRQKVAEELAKFPHAKLTFLDGVEIPDAFAVDPHTPYVKANYARFFLPRFIPDGEILYLDCDTVILCDIAALWDECQANPAPLQAARDFLSNFRNIFCTKTFLFWRKISGSWSA
jgi:lipopolysaccharide biosynthesis glycosyltransferase